MLRNVTLTVPRELGLPVVIQHLHMPQGESHVLRGPILLLGNSICPMSRFAERSHKCKKKNRNITPRIMSLGTLDTEVLSLASGEERPSERVVLLGFATYPRGFATQFCRPQGEKNLWHPG